MSGKAVKVWQAAFLIGLTLFISTSVAAFGLSLVTGAITFLAAVLSLLNSLVAPADPNGGAPQNVVLTRLKAVLNVSSYLKVLVVLVWAGALSMAAFALSSTYRSSRLTTIRGIVQTAEGEAADNAVVTLDRPHRPETVIAAQGEFAFEKVDPRSFPTGKAALQARWKNHQVRQEVDLSAAPGAVVLQLRAADLRLRVKYFELHQPEIAALIEGRASEELAYQINGQPYIVPSSPFEVAKRLFEGGFPDSGEYRGLSREEFNRLVRSADWKLLVHEYGPSLWKPVGREYVAHLQNGEQSALGRRLADAPDDFAIATFQYGSCDGEDESFAFVNWQVRQPKIRALVIENTLATSVRIGRFFLRENLAAGFRRRPADQGTLGPPPAGRPLFPPTILQPGEKILLPLEVAFVFETAEERLREDVSQRDRLRSALQNHAAASYALNIEGEPIDFDRASLLTRLSTSPKGFRFEDLVFGPSLSLVSLEVDDVTYAVRAPQEGQYVLLYGTNLPATSCPFLYTYDSVASEWRKEGAVLFGLNGKSKEATDAKRLRRFDGRLLLREEEPEVSFIDMVLVKAISPEGAESTLLATNDLLRSADGRYLRLEPGDEVEVVLDPARIDPAFTYIAVARGYYVPVEPSRLRR